MPCTVEIYDLGWQRVYVSATGVQASDAHTTGKLEILPTHGNKSKTIKHMCFFVKSLICMAPAYSLTTLIIVIVYQGGVGAGRILLKNCLDQLRKIYTLTFCVFGF